MRSPAALAKPEYLLRPSQALRRLWLGLSPPSGPFVDAMLPWGAPIRCRPDELIGRAILHLGLLDLVVSEVLWRLADPGELALDLGANIGQMTSLLAMRVGPRGRVLAFEPQPELCGELRHNVAAWNAQLAAEVVEVRELALSDVEGDAELALPAAFDGNRGTATLVAGSVARSVRVRTVSLDAVLPERARVGVAKLDVEGHELAVLRGAGSLLEERRLRDLVFEEHAPYPSAVSSCLESAGYEIFFLARGLTGPRLDPPGEPRTRSSWEAPSFLATADAPRAKARLAARGWRVLGA